MTAIPYFLALVLAADPGVGDFSLPDARGKAHRAGDWKGKKAVVLFFLGTECPVSNGYAPDYARLAKEFGPRGVLFYGVHPDPEVSADSALAHATEYRLPFPVLLDPKQAVTARLGVEVVPTAVVLSPQGKRLYRGRIDDRYSPEGRRREFPSAFDLKDALDAVLAGKPPAAAETTPFGCPLPAPAK